MDVDGDNPYQRKARLLQGLWREKKGYPARRTVRREQLGSRLAMPQAENHIWNFLTDNVRAVLRQEVLDPANSYDKVYEAPRIFENTLSSQPLCFNLFGELSLDLATATRVVRRMVGRQVASVSRFSFEHSPGRRDQAYTGDKSAFDVYIEYQHVDGGVGFVGIEVKYHEDMTEKPAEHRARYGEVASAMGCFQASALESLQRRPLNQVWREHLLAGSILVRPDTGFREGLFAFLYPSENRSVARVLDSYAMCLSNSDTFAVWTLESLILVLEEEVGQPWVRELRERYLG